MINFDLLKEICETPGAPGFEHSIRTLVEEQVKEFADEIKVDALGNLLAVKKGEKAKRILVAAHMDEISFLVTHIDDEGFIRFHTLGGFDPKTLTAQRVIIHGKKPVMGVMGSKPIHLMKADEKNKAPQLHDFFIDTGRNKEEVNELIQVGDPITRERSLIRMGPCINGKSLDNRVSVYILIETLKRLKGKTLPYDLFAAFTVQEEVGLRGAMNIAHQINPHFGIGLDVTIAFDVPGAQAHEYVTKLGKGTAVKIMDGSTICDPRMVKYLQWVADQIKLEYQNEVLTAGGTDTAGLQRYGKDGSIAGAISIPLRHIHQVIEMVHEKDIIGTIDLLEASLLKMDQGDWQHS